jgi:hypothetical protein
LFEEPIEFETTEGQGKVTGLKDTVLNMINKAVQSIVRGGMLCIAHSVKHIRNLFSKLL